MDKFSDNVSTDALLRQLSASSAYRVTRASAEVSGTLKETYEARSRDVETGDGADTFLVTTRIRFNNAVPEVWKKLGGISVCEPGQTSAKVVFRTPYASVGLHSSLVIRGKKLLLVINERSSREDRKLTEQRLRALVKELSAIHDQRDLINRVGYLEEYLPDKSMKASDRESSLDFRAGLATAIYMVSGYVNAQEMGYIKIRTFDPGTGEDTDDGYNTLEYAGWSDKKEERFFFESRLFVSGDGGDKDIRFEVWFHSDRTGKERKLLETVRTVKTHVR